MSEKEKDIVQTIAEAIPNMSDMDKGYFLGYAEALANRKEQEEKLLPHLRRDGRRGQDGAVP